MRRTWQDSPWFRSLGECEQDVFLAFIFGTGAALYRQWVAGGKKVPLERMAELAGRLLKEGADGFAKAVGRSYAPFGPAKR